MAHEVIMPKLGMAMVEGTVIAWKKRVGDAVKKGEGIVEISSEKIEMEVEAPADGILLRIDVAEGGVVPYGTVLGVVGQPNETITEVPAAGAAQVEAAASLAAAEPVTTATAAPGAPATGRTPAAGSALSREGVKISPVARKMAEEAGLDYTRIVGSGPQGRITKEDIEAALAARENAANASAGQVDAEPVGTMSAERIPVAGMRKVIAERMKHSLMQSAQLTITMHADVTDLLRMKEQVAGELQERCGVKLTVTDLIARAVVLALSRHKDMNSAFLGDHIERYEEIHLGIAVALEKGLVVPVIRRAGTLSLAELSGTIRSLVDRARQNQLAPDEMKGSTFTITNLGGYGVDTFTPILNPPETGILGVGAAKDTPVFVGDELVRRSMLPLSLTFDHRVLDGAPAAAFLATVKRYLEEPYNLLL
ncbi:MULTISPECIES: dihydrolipoamide acetyltransferase family protein [Bacillales]|uniref:dihydrolipoamide acetyltransferase family protein n=1 Tax=Brevibacillus TaxID=55080 RepID=UPI000E38540C|nr:MULTISPECIES: dihydrolipoamide acetyltransferase family protein [Bacillales]NNV03839.1 2-oxo acid dehydrogenase subunit E2 [Brevibacillus sp. MCWH]REK63763.1 MAG: branched-chain alpha-keto acid dehydrogenase subunit E2 [Brevibacillus sp.]UFJ61776.1 2-oxo acid dehydrogenase subunit E2 [Anoxybacillus sediminis]